MSSGRYRAYFPLTDKTALVPAESSDFVEDMISKVARKIAGESDVKMFACTSITISPRQTLRDRAIEWLRTRPRPLDLSSPVVVVFPNGPFDLYSDLFDVLFVTDEFLEGLGIVAPDSEAINRTMQNARMLVAEKARDNPVPSIAIKDFSSIKDGATRARAAVHYGRPASNRGPPTGLFQSSLGFLHYELQNLEERYPDPDQSKLQHTAKFISISLSYFLDETERGRALEGALASLIRHHDIRWHFTTDRMASEIDGCWMIQEIAGIIYQLKNEIGLSGDPWLKAILAFQKLIAQSKATKMFSQTNFPVIFICISANRFEVGTAIFTDSVYANKILSVEVGLGIDSSAEILRVARIFEAINTAFSGLQSYYAGLDTSIQSEGLSITHLLPAPSLLPSSKGTMPSLKFLRKLNQFDVFKPLKEIDNPNRSHGLYLAEMTEGNQSKRDVVVKFAVRYNDEAHRLLAGQRLAPELHACIPVMGGVFMVVMDFVQGQALQDDCPRIVYECVKKAIGILHDHDYVFGDLREPNILNLVTEKRGMLVDFDMVGRHKVDRYPASLNDEDIVWPDGVTRNGIMDKQHDLALLKKLEKRMIEV